MLSSHIMMFPDLARARRAWHSAVRACSLRGRATLLALASLCAASALPAQRSLSGAPSAASHRAAEDSPPSPDSPRAAVAAFLQLARDGDYEHAGAYLAVPGSASGRAPELARQLAAVLDQYVWIDLDEISGAAVGDTSDGLPPQVEQVATIPGAGGRHEPVRLVRAADETGPAWRFSRSTVARIPAWYSGLGDRWVREHLPAVMLRIGPFGILWWQWLALPALLVLAVALGALISRIARVVLAHAARRTSATWDDEIVARLGGPLTLAASLIVADGMLAWLALAAAARMTFDRLIHAGIFIAFFWGLWRLVDVAAQFMLVSRWAAPGAGGRSVLSLLNRAAKVAVLAIAIVAVLSALGYPVAGLLTGLGLGGLAFALAAQKTVENLFGAVSIGVDRPFREGDVVRVEDFVGTVEAIGLRSTRIRTPDRTLITMPNGKLADMRVESLAARDRLRLATVIGLVYETSAAQMRAVLEGFERVLRAQPKLWPDTVTVRFSQLSSSSLDIEVAAWFQTTDWAEFQLIRQEVLLQFMEVVERAGSSFAFPTRTVHLVPAAPPAAPSAPPPAAPVRDARRPGATA